MALGGSVSEWAVGSEVSKPHARPKLALSMDQDVVLQNCWLHSKMCLTRHKINKTGQVS